ncbi:PAS domain S-box protein, partial [Chloroflexota bacterium]
KRTMVALQEGEEKYRSLIEHSSDAIYLLNGNRFEVINRRFTEIFGVTTEEASSDDFDFMQLIAPSSRPMIAERTRKLEQGEDLSSRYEFTALDKSGNEMDFDVSVSYIPYQGKTATQGILRDITERVRSEKVQEKLTNRIRGQARQMLQIMETVPEGVVLLNANGRVMLANPVARASLQTLANANVGDELTKLGDRSLKKLLNSPPQGLWHEVRAGNQIFELIARPVEHYPEPQNWVMLIKDITQERETQKRIQQQEQLATVGQLAAGIAHDFNNIIATIVLYAQMTELADEIPETVRQRMVTIDQQAQHASKLIQQILDFSRQAVLERRPIELLPLVKEQVKLLKRTLPENITISLAQNQESYVVHADPTRMRQMITNLAVNARDAMSSGGEFHINLERAHFNGDKKPPLAEMEMGEWVLITASDTGTGIPEEILPRIFEPFFTTKAPLGSGLGLAQVHGIVAQHNGYIDVTTQVNKGTTFAIYLPAMPIAPTIMPPTSAPALDKGNGETILVVEDEWAVRKVLVDSLKSLNYHGLQAPNGKEAIKVLSDQAEQVALILSDVVMPEMGGVALLHQLRSQGLSVPIILMTGHPMERELKELRSQGLDAWLLKPPRLEKLAQTIAQVLRNHSA